MAEIGVVGAIVGLVGTGTKLSIAIFDFAASIGNAGRELQNVATEISDLCSMLKQVQTVLEHAHFLPSETAIAAAQRILNQCSKVFGEIDEIVGELRRTKGDEVFPSVDFVSKVKWTFSKKSKVLMLRSTLEACKSTLSVMLMTMLLAERVSQRGHLMEDSSVEEEQDKAMTQSLVIAQQCAVELLEHYEDEVEKEEEAAMLLPELNDAATRPDVPSRHKSPGRLFGMFSGLSLVTDLPTPTPARQKPPTRSERSSIWLDSILEPPDEPRDPHPGRHRQKRLSSVGTENAPIQLLRKWTNQGDHFDTKAKPLAPSQTLDASEIWRDSRFSFSGSKFSSIDEENAETTLQSPKVGIAKTPTDLISPKTAR